MSYPSAPWTASKHTFLPNMSKQPQNIACSELVAERDCQSSMLASSWHLIPKTFSAMVNKIRILRRKTAHAKQLLLLLIPFIDLCKQVIQELVPTSYDSLVFSSITILKFDIFHISIICSPSFSVQSNNHSSDTLMPLSATHNPWGQLLANFFSKQAEMP